jgi:hypothetical protein
MSSFSSASPTFDKDVGMTGGTCSSVNCLHKHSVDVVVAVVPYASRLFSRDNLHYSDDFFLEYFYSYHFITAGLFRIRALSPSQ